eukprot:s2453_g16.t1
MGVKECVTYVGAGARSHLARDAMTLLGDLCPRTDGLARALARLKWPNKASLAHNWGRTAQYADMQAHPQAAGFPPRRILHGPKRSKPILKMSQKAGAAGSAIPRWTQEPVRAFRLAQHAEAVAGWMDVPQWLEQQLEADRFESGGEDWLDAYSRSLFTS